MLEAFQVIIASVTITLSVAVTFLFFIYGFNSLYLVSMSRRYRSPKQPTLQTGKPQVAVHLPIYNEKYVVRRLVEACALMADTYGRERVRIVILDDSDDETMGEVDRVALRFRLQGYGVEGLRRGNRQGYKAGALQEGLRRTSEDFIVIFDSDFIPPADFLNRTIPYMLEDGKLGIVQTRWAHTNRDYNPLTKAIAIGIDGHFLVEQAARYASNCYLNFNGSAGLIRTKALREAGGWQDDTLAEDLDASYRIQLAGFNVLYLRDVESPGEVPPTITSIKRQQGRWACGSIQTARKILPKLLSSKSEPLRRKFEAYVHLTYYFVHPLIVASYLLAVTAAILNIDTISVKTPSFTGSSFAENLGQLAEVVAQSIGSQPLWVIFGSIIILSWAAAWIYYVSALRIQGMSLLRNSFNLAVLGLIGYGISVSNTIEVFKGLFTRKPLRFKRTPKYALNVKTDSWKDKKYQIPLDATILWEAVFFTLGVVAIIRALEFGNYGIIPIILLYAASYLAIALGTLFHKGRIPSE